MRPNTHQHAVIIGGSMAGLVAARVLSDHFKQVTLLERDCFPEGRDQRPGVPQGFHVHFLIAQGRLVYERLFPGLDDTLAAAGGELLDLLADGHLRFAPGLLPRATSMAVVRCATRLELEWEVRRRVFALPNVRVIENAHVTGLLASADNAYVEGVRLEPRDPQRGEVPAQLEADLVVDATGRRTRAPEWLAALGYEKPTVTRVDGHVSYATRLYEAIPLPKDTRGLWVFSRVPDTPRVGALVKVDGGRSMLFLGGIGKQHAAPTDDEGFLEFARSLIDPIIYEHIRNAKPLTKAYAYRQADNQWYDYAALTRLPEGFVPLGDSLCAFNPIYGQGMTVAALEAVALGEELSAHGLDDLARRAQQRFKAIVHPAWLFATGEDYRWPTTEGPPKPASSRFIHTYVDYMFDLALVDPKVAALLMQVGQMLKPLQALFTPRVALFVLRQMLTGKKPSNWGAAGKAGKAEVAPELTLNL